MCIGYKNLAIHFENKYLDVKYKKIFKENCDDFKDDCEFCLGTFDINDLKKAICTTCFSVHVKNGKCLHCQ